MRRRERVIQALSKKNPDKIPKDAWWTPPALKIFKEKTGKDDPAEYFNCEVREVLVNHIQDKKVLLSHINNSANAVYLPTEEYLSAYKNAENNIQQIFRVDEWGIGYEPCSTFHFTHMKHPMENYGTVNELLNYPFPQVEKNNISLKNEVKRLKEQDYYVMGNVVGEHVRRGKVR